MAHPADQIKRSGLPYRRRLNRYPDKTIKRLTTPKKIPTRRQVITFFNRIASGRDKPTTAIIKAMAVPKGIPLATSTCTIGTIPAALAYNGTAQRTDSGTATRSPKTCIVQKIPREQNRASPLRPRSRSGHKSIPAAPRSRHPRRSSEVFNGKMLFLSPNPPPGLETKRTSGAPTVPDNAPARSAPTRPLPARPTGFR